MATEADYWFLTEPSAGLMLLVDDDAVCLRSRTGFFQGVGDLYAHHPASRLGRLLPTLVPQLLEAGIAVHSAGDFRIPHAEFVTIEERGFDAFEGIVPWSGFVAELSSTGWLTDEQFRYSLRFYLGNQPVHLERKGCFVRRGTETYRLDVQTFALVNAVEAFNALSPQEKAGTDSLLRFAQIKGLAEEIGAEIDEYIHRERVIVPSRVGLDVIVGEDQRITFVPKVDGVPDHSLREAFLAVDDVDSCYTCPVGGGERVRVVLTDEQRQVFKRMQRVRHVGRTERTEILRNPVAVFDGISGAVEINTADFGPRVFGIGDFPFVARPYLRFSATGVFDDPDAGDMPGRSRFEAGIACNYADGSNEQVAFSSRKEILDLNAAANHSFRSGLGEVSFRGKSIVVDRPFLASLEELVGRITARPGAGAAQKKEAERRFLLIYTNEEQLEYEEDLSEGAGDEDLDLPSSLLPSAQLRDHQRRGVAWLQRNFRLGRHGCLLADDMGLGKTLQTLTFLAWLIEQGHLSEQSSNPKCAPWNPILIVAPVILLESEVWIKDMRQFFRNDGAVFKPWVTLHGKQLKTHRISVRGSETLIGTPVLDLTALRKYRVVITNYESLTNYQHSFARMKDGWTVVVTDEAQEYKTPGTKISHALKSLSPRFRLAATGTPVETRLLDVWNIFDFLQPGRLLRSSSEFSKRFEHTDKSTGGTPLKSQIDDLRKTLRFGKPDAFVLRRSKVDILKDLPQKHEHRLECNLSEDQRRWHLELLRRAREAGDGSHPLLLLQQLMRVSQHPKVFPRYEPVQPDEALSLCPKLAQLVQTLQKIRVKKEKALIFTRSLDMQQLLAEVLQAKLDVRAEIINGATSRFGGDKAGQQTRHAILDRFRESPGFDLLILSPDVAGIGLTLVEANHVFHYGRWWNPAKEAQTTDRAYRIGQTKDVHVYYLIGVDPLRQFKTFDERLEALIARRRSLAADFLAPMPEEAANAQELYSELVEAPRVASPTMPRLGQEGIRLLPWDSFEALTAYLWSRDNKQVVLTPKTGDEKVDVLAFKDRTVELIQCKHTMWGAPVDVDAVFEMIQAFDGYRARRFRQRRGLIFRMYLVTNGSFTAAAKRTARERDVQLLADPELMRILSMHSCTEADIHYMQTRRLASMRDVQAQIDRWVGSD